MKRSEGFNFETNRILSGKYEIVSKLGRGWEGEVYLVKEVDTGIERAAKFFYPDRNPQDRTVKSYAKKLHRLRACNSLIKYVAKEKIKIKGESITYLLSEFVEGVSLGTYLDCWHRSGMNFYQALHLFYAVVKAVEEIHINKEWHGDLHADNIIIQKSAYVFDLKLIDVFQVSHGQRGSIQGDVYDLCDLLYECVGGSKRYAKQPQIIKNICKGRKDSLIKKQFKNATQLRVFLENSNWENF